MKRKILQIGLISLLGWLTATQVFAQSGLMKGKHNFTKGDTLRGTLNEMRSWFDVTFYDLNIKVDPEKRTISGYNDIHFKVLAEQTTMQIDLFKNLDVDKLVLNEKELEFTREYNAVFIKIPETLAVGSQQSLRFYYSGKPTVAKNAPWDGGFSWKKDKNEKDWFSVSCQGIGASVWWPNKDHQSEEPDSMRISFAVPNTMIGVANGQPRDTIKEGDFTRYVWFVENPINNYGVSISGGDYVHFSDSHVSGKDTLSLNYYVLSYHLEKAKKHFEQVKPMMKCFEEYLGPYPFWEDGFALIETPFLGMEHQSGIAYGNNYKTGYNGSDYSMIGLNFDYIIIHEAGHEWWGNSVTSYDIADMWIHEGICTYSEAIYVECLHGYERAMDYVNAKKRVIGNSQPIIGHYGVNKEGSPDMYNKGMLIFNTVRHMVDNDKLWFDIIKGMADDYKHAIVTHDTIVNYISKKADMDVTKVFDQYMKHPNIPVLEYKVKKRRKKILVDYRWKTDVKDFVMPMKYKDKKGDWQKIQVTNEWQKMTLKKMKPKNFEWAERMFYVKYEKK